MAQQFEQIPNNIEAGEIVRAGHVSQSLVAFTGQEAYDITISGSLTVTGSIFHDGAVDAGGALSSVVVRNSVTGEYQLTGSYYNGATSGTSGTSGTGGTSGTSGVDGTSGTSGTTAVSLTLGDSSQGLGDHSDSSLKTITTIWSQLTPGATYCVNTSGVTKSYFVVLGLEYVSDHTAELEYNVQIRLADSANVIVYQEWWDTVNPWNTGDNYNFVTKTYVFHANDIPNSSDFTVWVRQDGAAGGSYFVDVNYCLFTVTQLDGVPQALIN